MKADAEYHKRNEADARAAVYGWLGGPGTPRRRTLQKLIEALRPVAVEAIGPVNLLLSDRMTIAMFARVVPDRGATAFVAPDGTLQFAGQRLLYASPTLQEALEVAARKLHSALEVAARALHDDGFPIDPLAAVNLSVLAQLLLCPEVDLTLPADAILEELFIGGLTGSAADGRNLMDVSDHVSGRLEDMAQRYRRLVRAAEGGVPIAKPNPKRRHETTARRRAIILDLLRAFPDSGPRDRRPTWRNVRFTRGRDESWPGGWLQAALRAQGVDWPSAHTFNADLKAVRGAIQTTEG